MRLPILPRLPILGLAFLGGGATLSIVGATLPSLAGMLGSSEEIVSLTAAFFSAGGLAIGGITILLARRVALERLLPIALVAQAVGLGSVPAITDVRLLYLAGAVAGGGFAMTETLVIVLTNRRPDAASAHGVLNSVFAFGAIAMPIVVVLILRMADSPGPAYLIASSVHAVAAMAALTLHDSKPSRNQTRRFPSGYMRLGLVVIGYVGAEAVLATWLAALAERTGLIAPAWSPLGASLFWAALLVGRISGTVLIRYLSVRVLLRIVLAVGGLLIATSASLIGHATALAVVSLIGGVIVVGPVFQLVVTELGETDGMIATVLLLAFGAIGATFATSLAAWAAQFGASWVIAIPAALLAGCFALVRAFSRTALVAPADG